MDRTTPEAGDIAGYHGPSGDRCVPHAMLQACDHPLGWPGSLALFAPITVGEMAGSPTPCTCPDCGGRDLAAACGALVRRLDIVAG